MSEDNPYYWNSINTIDKRIESFKEGYKQNIAILGDRSRIDYIRYEYLAKRLNNRIMIYVNISYAGDKEIFTNIAYSILSGYLKSRESLDKMISKTSYVMPATTSFIKNILKTKGHISFLKSLELINTFINEVSQSCIFVIDEFTELRRVFKNFHQDFSKFIMFQNKCMLIITSSRLNQAKDMLTSELNFLFGNFECVNLNDNAYIENYFYLKRILEPLKPTPMFLSFFINTAGVNISYLNIIAQEINKHYADGETKCIETVMKESMLKEESYFFQRFISRIDAIKNKLRDSVTALKLILTISNGYIRKKEILSLSVIKERTLKSQLNKLAELDYISSNGDVYQIKDSLFSFWLSHVFSYYFYPVTLGIESRKRLFESRLKETIEVFHDTYTKDATERIIDLITTFKDDYLKVRRQKIRLPHIDRTKILSYPDKRFNFLIGEGKEIMFVGIKEDAADDTDIVDYIERTRIFKNKKVKKIFITLDDFSTSARIIANENKLITWNVNEVNDLLRIYRKPIIINENIGNI